MDNSKQDKISMRPIFKSINQILSKHQQKTNQPKNNTEFENDKISNDQSILKLSQFLSQNQNDNINIGKYVQEKIEQKRINNFRQLYKNAVKYQSDEEENGCILSSKELQQVEHIKNRRKVILKMAQRKSPKFLYPLGPKIRVPNFLQKTNISRFNKTQLAELKEDNYLQKEKPTISRDDISIQKLDSPPKDKCFPTSSMQEDYLNIKIQQIVKSFL